MKNDLHDQVSKYYGKTIQSTDDLKTNACHNAIEYPSHIKSILSELHDETMSKYYGCGLTIPSQLEGLKVLDLGSGSGRDVFVLSEPIGKSGMILGFDMTEKQHKVVLEKDSFALNKPHFFETSRLYTISGITYLMLHDSRFKDHFEFWGDYSTHFGIFEGCGSSAPFSLEKAESEGVASCC